MYLDPTPAEVSSLNSNKRKRVNLPPLEQRVWDAKTAMPFVMAAEERHKKIDVSVPIYSHYLQFSEKPGKERAP